MYIMLSLIMPIAVGAVWWNAGWKHAFFALGICVAAFFVMLLVDSIPQSRRRR